MESEENSYCALPRHSVNIPQEVLTIAINSSFVKLCYKCPTAEQKLAITNFVKGQDVLICLPTGGGKSLCYATITLIFDYIVQYLNAVCTVVSRASLLPFLRSDDGEGVWSIELTFLSQLRNLATGVGMKTRPHVHCEYCYYYLFYIYVKN